MLKPKTSIGLVEHINLNSVEKCGGVAVKHLKKQSVVSSESMK
jgi:hypothetical protein